MGRGEKMGRCLVCNKKIKRFDYRIYLAFGHNEMYKEELTLIGEICLRCLILHSLFNIPTEIKEKTKEVFKNDRS